jgi:hypothetical protein
MDLLVKELCEYQMHMDVQGSTDSSSLMMHITINTHQFCKLHEIVTLYRLLEYGR